MAELGWLGPAPDSVVLSQSQPARVASFCEGGDVRNLGRGLVVGDPTARSILPAILKLARQQEEWV